MLEKNYDLQKALFNEYFKNSLIFHIPHSSTFIPIETGFKMNLVECEISLLTDWKTDEIFNVIDTKKLVTPFSRIFCDVERFTDDLEELFKVGRGFFYTHNDAGEILREETSDIKKVVFEKYYKNHHQIFEQMVQETLDVNGFVTIIDCHSFSNIPFKTDLDQSLNRPDICIGTDDFHTPYWLKNTLVRSFEKFGFNCKVNSPYSGSIVPQKFYKNNKMVSSVMIEINRNLYMKGDEIILEKVLELNKIIEDIFANQF
jgi:N-formylglutamate amidohydrolase